MRQGPHQGRPEIQKDRFVRVQDFLVEGLFGYMNCRHFAALPVCFILILLYRMKCPASVILSPWDLKMAGLKAFDIRRYFWIPKTKSVWSSASPYAVGRVGPVCFGLTLWAPHLPACGKGFHNGWTASFGNAKTGRSLPARASELHLPLPCGLRSAPRLLPRFPLPLQALCHWKAPRASIL